MIFPNVLIEPETIVSPTTNKSLSNLTLPLNSYVNPEVGILFSLIFNQSVPNPTVPSVYIEIEDDCHLLDVNKCT